jgi:hypothetical protein
MAGVASVEGVVRNKMHQLLDSLHFKVGYIVITIGQLMPSVFLALPLFNLAVYLINQTLRGEQERARAYCSLLPPNFSAKRLRAYGRKINY